MAAMNQTLNQDLLIELGFPYARVGEPEPVPLPSSDPTARGFTRSADIKDPWAQILQPPGAAEVMLPAGVPVALDAGFDVAWGESLERLYVTGRRPFRVVPQDARGTSRRDETVVVTLAEASGPFLLLASDDCGLGIEVALGAVSFFAFEGRPYNLPPSFEAVPPVAAWLAAIADDGWLTEAVRAHLERGRPWDHAVAAGLVQRLHQPAMDEVRRRVAALLGNGRADTPAPAVLWATELAPEQAEALDREAAEEAQILSEALDEALAHVDPEDVGWCADMRTLLVRRDDLEGVRVLLRHAQHDSRVAAVLAALDDRMADDVGAWPELPLGDDRRLIRAAGASPDGWWVEPWHLASSTGAP